MLNQLKSHPMLDVRKRSRLFIKEGGKTRPAETGQHLAVCSVVLVGGKKSPKKQKKGRRNSQRNKKKKLGWLVELAAMRLGHRQTSTTTVEQGRE